MGGWQLRAARLALAAALWRCAIALPDEVIAAWEFDASLERWAAATPAEMQADIVHEGGEMRAHILGEAPHFDSPPLFLRVDDAHHVVFRMKYHGAATTGRIVLRGSDASPEEQGAAEHSASASFAIAQLSGKWATYYVPLPQDFWGAITRVRVHPVAVAAGGGSGGGAAPRKGERFFIDYIRIARAPRVRKVRGCLNAYHAQASPAGAVWHYEAVGGAINGFLRHETHRHLGGDEPFASTYNCPTAGGATITIEGSNFGAGGALVTIGGKPCADVVHGPPAGMPYARQNGTTTAAQTILTCTLPAVAHPEDWGSAPASSRPGTAPLPSAVGDRAAGLVAVTVANAVLPGLRDTREYLAYRVSPPPPGAPQVYNVAARSVDIAWGAPGASGALSSGWDGRLGGRGWDALTTTGYVVAWRRKDGPPPPRSRLPTAVNLDAGAGGAVRADLGRRQAFWRARVGAETGLGLFRGWHTMYVGNLTSATSVRGLSPDTAYEFAVATAAEDTRGGAWTALDKYGRREPLEAAYVSALSAPTAPVRTAAHDVSFDGFAARKVLNASTADGRATLGPAGQWAGEGHYGLYLVGDANLQNCNGSVACCDGFDRDAADALGIAGACAKRAACFEPASAGSSTVPSNVASVDRSGRKTGAAKAFGVFGEDYRGAAPSMACGDRLRLTASHPRRAGAAWYPRTLDVREGFETTFTFELSQPSRHCSVMDDVHTRCRSRGGDGFAFVVQHQSPTALGEGGGGLGYAGIRNSLAVEFDTYYNPEAGEPYENHVSVHTNGWRSANSARQRASLGASVRVPDLTDGPRSVRVHYTPSLDVDRHVLGAAGARGGGLADAMPGSARMATFLSNAEHGEGGQADWATGFGVLSVYVDDAGSPALVVPLNLDATLRLEHGRAWVGFTAATGDGTYQTHDILDWRFTSLREEVPYYPPPVVNGVGAHACVDGTADGGGGGDGDGGPCVHR